MTVLLSVLLVVSVVLAMGGTVCLYWSFADSRCGPKVRLLCGAVVAVNVLNVVNCALQLGAHP